MKISYLIIKNIKADCNFLFNKITKNNK